MKNIKSKHILLICATLIVLWLLNAFISTDNNFSAFSSFVSALALAGLIITIIQQKEQIISQREDLKLQSELLELQRKEMQQTNVELENQKEQMKRQADLMSLQQFENIFFNLLKIHRDNVLNVIYKEKEGIEAFDIMLDDLPNCFKLASEIYYIHFSEDIDKKIFFNLAYSLFFLGKNVERIQDPYLIKLEKMGFDDAEIFKVFDLFRKSQLNLQGSGKYLGHYFRNLYNIVKYVNAYDSSILSCADKYKYIKILRTQLSNSELIVFYLNSLSDYGSKWENNNDGNVNNHLITKYNLISNINIESVDNSLLFDWVTDIIGTIKDNYPMVVFEGEEKSKRRIELEKNYN